MTDSIKSFFSVCVLLTAAVTSVVRTEAQEATSRTIPARVIPVPVSVSPELQKLLAQPPLQWPNPPKTLEDWRAVRARLTPSEQTTAEELARLREQFGVKVTPQMMGGVPCYILTPKEIPARNRKRLILNLHYGGFVLEGGEAGTDWAIHLASMLGYKVIVVDYRLLPDHPFPAAIDDISAVWKILTKSSNPRSIAVVGGSVGGGLALSLVQRAKLDAIPLPGAVVSMSPGAADLSKTGDTWYTNAGLDGVAEYDGFWAAVFKLYANGHDLSDPAVSPLYGDFTGFPPTYLVSGTRDAILSDTVRVQRKLLQAGVLTHLAVVEGLPHPGFLMMDVPEVREVYQDIGKFLDANLGR